MLFLFCLLLFFFNRPNWLVQLTITDYARMSAVSVTQPFPSLLSVTRTNSLYFFPFIPWFCFDSPVYFLFVFDYNNLSWGVAKRTPSHVDISTRHKHKQTRRHLHHLHVFITYLFDLFLLLSSLVVVLLLVVVVVVDFHFISLVLPLHLSPQWFFGWWGGEGEGTVSDLSCGDTNPKPSHGQGWGAQQ